MKPTNFSGYCNYHSDIHAGSKGEDGVLPPPTEGLLLQKPDVAVVPLRF